MVIVIITPTENTINSAIRVPFPPTRITMTITIYTAIRPGAIHLIVHGNTTTLIMVGPIRMYKTMDKITGVMTGEIKSRNNGISTMKIMNRPRIKEKAAAGIIINNLTVSTELFRRMK